MATCAAVGAVNPLRTVLLPRPFPALASWHARPPFQRGSYRLRPSCGTVRHLRLVDSGSGSLLLLNVIRDSIGKLGLELGVEQLLSS